MEGPQGTTAARRTGEAIGRFWEKLCLPGLKWSLAVESRGSMSAEAQTDSSSPPAPFPRLLHTPPEEPLPFFVDLPDLGERSGDF